MANQQSPKPKGYSVIEVGEDDDIEFLRKQANDIERMWLKKHTNTVSIKSHESKASNTSEQPSINKVSPLYAGGASVSNAKYYAKNREKLLAQRKAKRAENPGARNEYFVKWRQKHKEQIAVKNAAKYAKNKLGLSTCPNCGHDFLITNRSTPLCQECVKAAYALGKNDSTYNPGKPYREILRKAGRLTPELDNENWHAHHIDGVRDHDVNENFVILTKADHTRLHNLYRAELKKCMERGIMPPSLAAFTWYVIREYHMEYH